MNYIMAAFAMLGALDLIIGNRFGLGKEFEKGFYLLGAMALSMIGMIVIAPLLGQWISPALNAMYETVGIDPSSIPVMFLANDMGGQPLASAVAKNETIGYFNGLVVASMIGATVSFTIPVALGIVKKEKHPAVLLGLLCGIVTVPVGCFVAGLVIGIPLSSLLLNMLPLILFSLIVAIGLFLIPDICVKIFGVFGKIINIAVIIGLALGLFQFLTKIVLIDSLDTYEAGGMVCLNAAAVMAGAFPFLFVLSKLIGKPLKWIGKKVGLSEKAILGLFSALATAMMNIPVMNEMEDKGVAYNAAFTVSAAFTFAGHLAYTMSINADYLLPMIIGKLISGFSSLVLVAFIYKRVSKKKSKIADS